MSNRWRYRVKSSLGVILFTGLAVGLVNSQVGKQTIGLLPVLRALPTSPSGTTEGLLEILTTIFVVVISFTPLYKPRPRRILDIVTLAQKRTITALFALAAIGYFDYTYRLPRATLLAVTPLLLGILPTWFVWIRRRPDSAPKRAVVVGNSLDEIERVIEDIDFRLVGYLCPTHPVKSNNTDRASMPIADGGVVGNIKHLGGLSRLEDILVNHDIDTVVLAFEYTDRGDFFGALDACYEHGVTARVHRDRADSVLTEGSVADKLVKVDIEPWDLQDYVLKRLFDLVFAGIALLVLSPVVVLISVVIKLEDGGPIFYKQERTAMFGETFSLYKFRSMAAEPGTAEPVEDEENDRITDVGNFLRQTHLDEIPQLWSIFVGDMSVVGPRAVWTREEPILKQQVPSWEHRWFVKPGLTGLAQVNDAGSTEPEAKFRYDLQYVKHQSFLFDVKIVLRQVWKVLGDIVTLLR